MKCLSPFFLIILFFTVFSLAEAEAQNCTGGAIWNFDPEPVNGLFEPGTNVEVCVEVVYYPQPGGSWLNGIELVFPEGWDMEGLTVLSSPEACSGGEWVYLDSLECGFLEFGPGFYYDNDSPADSTFCVNFGDQCDLLDQSWSFCIEASVNGDCSGGEVDIYPKVRLLSDSDIIFGWSVTCPDPIYVTPDFPSLGIDCCGLNAGISPGTIAVCEPGCLIDFLDDPDLGGFWTGPAGYVDPSIGCGSFEPGASPLGEYTYSVVDGLCIESSTITVVDPDVGLIGEVYACYNSANLYEELGNDYPLDGTWFDPEGNVVEGGVVDFDVDPLGIYTYEFSADAGCAMTLEIEALPDYEVGEEQSISFCDESGVFCPYDVLQSLQDEDVELSTGGNWILYDSTGTIFYQLIPTYDACFNVDLLVMEYGQGMTFTYVIGAPPCPPHLVDLEVVFGSSTVVIDDVSCSDFIDLLIYTPEGADPGGIWTDGNGQTVLAPLENNFPVGSTQTFTYTTLGDSGCLMNYVLELYIADPADEGGDLFFDFCGDGSEVALDTLLPEGVSMEGVFSPADAVVLLPQNSGTYTYTLPDDGCGAATYALHLNIGESLNYMNFTSTVSPDGEDYTVGFDIAGGNPPYSVNGFPIVGSSFVSGLIPIGTPFSFVVSDSGPCGDLVVSGVSPDECAADAGCDMGELCANGVYCLSDYLTDADAGGVWTGPDGVLLEDCGAYDSEVHPAGNYYYTVTGMNDCIDSALVMLVDTVNLGLVQTVAMCDGLPLTLNNVLTDYEPNGIWFQPGYPEVVIPLPSGIIDPAVHPEGIYTYIYESGDGCVSRLSIQVVFSVEYNADLNLDTITVCYTEVFSPAEAFGIEEWDSDGSWIVYDENDAFVGFYPDWDEEFAWPYFEEQGPQLKFLWTVGTPPCDPQFYEKVVTMDSAIVETVYASSCASEINLEDYLPYGTGTEGQWMGSDSLNIGSVYDCGSCEDGSVQEFHYNYDAGDGGCDVSLEVVIEIDSPNAGSYYVINLCADGSGVDLISLLGDDASGGGEFDIDPPFIIADSAWAGDYVYSFPDEECSNDSAVYTINFVEPFSFTADMVCEGDGTTFSAVIEFSGGFAPYSVDGEEISGSVYVIAGLDVGADNGSVLLDDLGFCNPWEVIVPLGVSDSDGDGICDAMDITGCMDPEASNYNPLAINPGFCFYEMGSPDITYTDGVYEGLGLIGSGGSGGVGGDDGLGVLIFPNPAVDVVSLDIRGLSPCNGLDKTGCNVVVEVRDILGVLRYSEVVVTNGGRVLERVDLDGFASGIYLVRVVAGDDEFVGRVVLE